VLVAPDGWLGLASVLAQATPDWRNLPSYPSRIIPSLKTEIPAWLEQWKFDRYVTLATNDPSLAGKAKQGSSIPHGFIRDRLREWDGRVNHAILGKHWAKRHSDRMWSFFFLEKPNVNPHWHGLVRFFPVDNMEISDQERMFDANAERIWKALMPSGSVDIQPIIVGAYGRLWE
jgi:hypothetical protein